ncbi:MAG: TlpA family protein disulfide reductase [Deltaproteobacteria bacterium]|nr:TlpA family protein disulfide reductase [Deltaproteobacteria bacterium]
MKVLNKSSVLGFILGFIAFPIIFSGGAYLYYKIAFGDSDASGGGGLEPPALPGEHVASLDWTVKSLDGTVVNLGEHARDKTLFLNFWATWCGPCVAEMASIEKLHSQFGGEMAFVCVSNEQAETLKKFMDDRKFSLPVFVADAEPPRELNESAIPATFIISPQGKILLKHMGGADWAHESVVAFLREQLGRG